MNSSKLYDLHYSEDMVISIVNGNEKVGKGVWCFNLLPGDKPISTKKKGELTNLRGTCEGCCSGCEGSCYAIRDTRRHHNNCIPSQGKNTLIIRNNLDRAFAQLKQALINNKANTLRYHSAGEIISYEHLEHIVKLASEMPSIKFYIYTKRFEFVDRYLTANRVLPDNLTINISIWHENGISTYLKWKGVKGIKAFVFDDKTFDYKAYGLNIKTYCPAYKVDTKGKVRLSHELTCAVCGLCISGPCKVIGCLEH